MAQNIEKFADVILERSLISCNFCLYRLQVLSNVMIVLRFFVRIEVCLHVSFNFKSFRSIFMFKLFVEKFSDIIKYSLEPGKYN